MKSFTFYLFIGITLLALTGCASPTPLPTPAPIPATNTALPPASPTPSPSPTLEPTSTSTLTPTPVPTVCSPLGVQPLETISEIITQPFAMPRIMDDGSYLDDGHHGLDLGYYTREGELFTGTPVLSALDGVIAAIVHDRPPYGNMLLIETRYEHIPPALIAAENIPAGDSVYIAYGHLQNLQPLQPGDVVTCGQLLAETGLTGTTSGPHLHFETRYGPSGQTFNSIAYYRADATREELASYERWRMSGEFKLFDPMELLAGKPANK